MYSSLKRDFFQHYTAKTKVMGHSVEKHWASRDLVVCTNRCLSHNDLHRRYFETFSLVGELTRVPVKGGHAEYAAHTVILHQAQNLCRCPYTCPLKSLNSPQFNRADNNYYSEMFSGLPACVNIQGKFLAKPYLYISWSGQIFGWNPAGPHMIGLPSPLHYKVQDHLPLSLIICLIKSEQSCNN